MSKPLDGAELHALGMETGRTLLDRQLRYASLIAIDPGLDRVSLARFVVDRQLVPAWPSWDAVQRARCFADVEHIVTSPRSELALRLASIFGNVHELFRRQLPDLVTIELPAVAGGYQRVKSRQKAMGGEINTALQSLALATGAIIAAATHAVGAHRVQLVPAFGMAKAARLAMARSALTKAGKTPPRNQDDLDAIANGLGAVWPLSCR